MLPALKKNDAPGNPIGFTLTGAEQADIGQADVLLAMTTDAQAVIADNDCNLLRRFNACLDLCLAKTGL